MKYLISSAVCSLLLFLLCIPKCVQAQDFVYIPKNPAFGGNPINYQWMLNSANAQNKYETSRDLGLNQDPLTDFQQSLQRQVLSQLTRDVIRERFGDIDLSQPNTYEFGEFSIDIIPGINGIDINILNISTGEQTTVTVPNI